MKQIALTFIGDSPNYELVLTTHKDGVCIGENTVMLHCLKLASQLRFLTWAMSHNWHYSYHATPNYHGTYLKFHRFVLAPDGQDTHALQWYFNAMKEQS